MKTLDNLEGYYQRPPWVRRLNAMGDSVGGAERIVPIEVDSLIDQARQSLGLVDFGDFDGDWYGRLQALVAAIEETGRMHTLGRLMTRQEILRGLRTRLLLTRMRNQQPKILEETITAPLVISGPARSGTSILFELLSLDPQARGPLGWEAIHPVPVDDATPERRRELTECEQEFWADIQPEFETIHELRSDLPVECITLQLPSFAGFHWLMMGDIPSWIPDPQAAMDYHRALLQVLQFGGKRRNWVLKTPIYLMTIDLLFATYPDAWVFVTHRDPVKTAASALSTLATVRWLRSDHVDVEAMRGAGMAEMVMDLGRRRDGGELPDRFVDLHFAELVADPAGTIEKAYARMERPFTPEFADAIRSYIDAKPKGKFGKHRYSAQEWGYDPATIRRELAPYTERYGIALED